VKEAFTSFGDLSFGRLQQPEQNLPALGRLQIQRKAQLVRVFKIPGRVLVRGAQAALRNAVESDEGAALRLDLDDFGAEFGKKAGAGRSSDKGAHVDDLDAFEWSLLTHFVFPPMAILPEKSVSHDDNDSIAERVNCQSFGWSNPIHFT
jgi:hypothetical protein